MASAPAGAGRSGMGFPAAAVVTGASQIVGGALNGKAAKHAADIQGQTSDRALAFAREQEAERKSEWQQQQATAAAAWKAKQAMVAPFLAGGYSVLGKYGIPVSMSSLAQGPSPMGAPAGGPPRPSMGAPQMGMPQMSTNVPQAPVPGPDVSMSGLAANPLPWNDWKKYGA